MVHNDIQNQLTLLIRAPTTPLVEVAQDLVELPQLVPGQRLPAFVIASLPNGRFHVSIEGQTLDLNLPAETKVGSNVELEYIADKPRLTFTLVQNGAKTTPLPTSNINLSQTGKFLGSLLQQNTQTGTTAANALNGANNIATVLPAPPTSVAQFASALRNAISQSGFFYESHQAEWVSGERTFDSLLREPQAKLSTLVTDQNQKNSSADVANTSKSTLENVTRPLPLRTELLRENHAASSNLKLSADNLSPPNNHAVLDNARTPVHPQSAPIVQQQLNILENHQFVWQGQVWPGQQLEWEIEEDSHGNGRDAEEGASWNTRLHLDFPSLGGVTAHLALQSGKVKVDFSVEREDSVTLLQTEAPALAQSMESSGLKVAGLVVRQDGRP